MTARPRSDEKAKEIVEAARTCLVDRGYAQTTVTEIATEAGVSRGLLHYYFADKEDLLVQLTRRNTDRGLEMIDALFATGTTAEELAAGLVSRFRALLTEDPMLFTAVFEGWAAGRQYPAVEAEVRDGCRRLRTALRDRVSEAARQNTISSRTPVEGFSTLLGSLLDGLAFRLEVEPELAQDETVWQALEASLLLLFLLLK